MLNEVLLVLLGAVISPIFTRLFTLFRSRYCLELNQEFYKLKFIKRILKITDRVEPYLLKTCGILSFVVGIMIFVFGLILNKVFSACLLLPFFIIAGCMFYYEIFPFKIVLKKQC